jgi:hypothetical protein
VSSAPGYTTCLSIDLDGIDCYHGIHGLPPPDDAIRDVALRRWLPRFVTLLDELAVPATFFVIGRDLRRELDHDGAGARALQAAARAGHELANHSHDHRYDLSLQSDEEQRLDLERCHRALVELGHAPQGFRAPGYTHDARMLACVAAAGYRYDASSLPSWPYYLAKVAAIAWTRLARRPSRSIASGARSFFGPTAPHVRDDSGLVELPITTVGALRLPLVGTFVLAGPTAVRRALTEGAIDLPHVHLELHAIDLADAHEDGLDPGLVRLRPELAVDLAVRRERLAELLRARQGHTRLVDLATRVRG